MGDAQKVRPTRGAGAQGNAAAGKGATTFEAKRTRDREPTPTKAARTRRREAPGITAALNDKAPSCPSREPTAPPRSNPATAPTRDSPKRMPTMPSPATTPPRPSPLQALPRPSRAPMPPSPPGARSPAWRLVALGFLPPGVPGQPRAVLHGLLRRRRATWGCWRPCSPSSTPSDSARAGPSRRFWPSAFSQVFANHFVIAFKGQPVVPADLFALNTAAAGERRVLAAGPTSAWSHAGGAVRGRLHRPAPRPPRRRSPDRAMAANAAMAVVLVAAFGTVDQRARHRRGLPLRRGGTETRARSVRRPGDHALLPQARPGPLPRGSRRLLGRRSRTAARRSRRGWQARLAETAPTKGGMAKAGRQAWVGTSRRRAPTRCCPPS